MGTSEGGDFPPKKAEMEVDFPAKKLARQLDFTGFGGGGASPAVLPDHLQQIQQRVSIPSQHQLTEKPSQQMQQLSQQHKQMMPMQQLSASPLHSSIRSL